MKKHEWFVHEKIVDFELTVGTQTPEECDSLNEHLAQLEDKGWEIVSVSPYFDDPISMVVIVARRPRGQVSLEESNGPG